MVKHHRYLVVHKTRGIFIGTFRGMFFWSREGDGDQDCAVVFDSPDQAKSFLTDAKVMDAGNTEEYTIKSVSVEDPQYATIVECMSIGEEAWIPNKTRYINLPERLH